ncbi:sigma 54-interacting transcriptional regulator [Sphingomonas sp. CGMCC 1.13654]|uniref:Sigma 54-interacting transcriptional regulator n=1 Tax=Sphingomonas chungangi TaxID=2683589 RepID=A0A838L2S5_9SPHN|nr:sigma 54-interacting transcriptional regulator [Sphingomonas chungangi]MBA2932945.1 sigma 54-interacting transcriptional regulator [Sphingomonas chungangi]MVW56565.1 AAA domain-containing protein [Sphingomonas chungangi]
MNVIGISARAAQQNPAISAWLAGVGIAVRPVDVAAQPARDEVRILAADEISRATVRDILIETGENVAPALILSSKGMPARIRFGFEDMAFGLALLAELVRPEARPAVGEPESAIYLKLAEKVAGSDATVLVLGETGTGKEGIARFIHASSPRIDKPFVAVNCAALPDTMLEAILFGHAKGAFTGAAGASEGLFRAADGGTLFLDEIAEMPLALQAKLLRAVQEREVLPVGATQPVKVDVRIIAAANRELAIEVQEGRFRADLYWRLNVMPLALKPLKARRLDIRAITAALILRHTREGESVAWPTANALDRLMAHEWPGNVRELDNVIQRALLLRMGDRIEADDLAIEVMAQAAPQLSIVPSIVPVAGNLAEVARASEIEAIRVALEETGGRRLLAAAKLGISERTLRYRLAEMRGLKAA